MRFLSILAALGAAFASPFTDAQNGISARDASDSVRFIFINNLDVQQKVYIVGRVEEKWAFVQQNGSIALVGHFNSLADVAITLAANEKDRKIDIPRPLVEGRIYSAESDLHFITNGETLGHPHPGHNAQAREAIRWNSMDFQLPSDSRFLSAAIDYQLFIGTPTFSFSITSSDGRTESVRGLRNDCVENFCKGEKDGKDAKLCVVNGSKYLRIFQPLPFAQKNPQAFAQYCQTSSGDGRGIGVVADAQQMTITLG